MEARDPVGLTPAEGRRFALTLVPAFLLLGAFSAWRGRPALGTSLVLIAGILLLAGLLAPSHLGPVHRAWMGLGRLLSRVTTPVVYTVMYLVVLTPVGVLRRTVGRSPLARDPNSNSYWQSRPVSTDEARRAGMERRF